jgi:hypothetical protein
MEPLFGASMIFTIAIICLSTVCVIGTTAIAIAIPIYLMRNNQKKLQDLAATGIQGQATVLQLEDTGMRINDDPRVAVTLQVQLPGYPPYVVRKTITLPLIRMSQVQVGSVVAVLADPTQPGNPDKVALMLR